MKNFEHVNNKGAAEIVAKINVGLIGTQRLF